MAQIIIHHVKPNVKWFPMLDLNQRPSPCQGDALANYANRNQKWQTRRESNSRPEQCECSALATELLVHKNWGVIWGSNPRFQCHKLACCRYTNDAIEAGGATASRSQMCFTTLAFQASPFANSGIAPCKFLADGADSAPARDLQTSDSLAKSWFQLTHPTIRNHL